MNGLDKGKEYISSVVGHKIHLKLPSSTSRWKDTYFYIIGDFWGDRAKFTICSTWNHNFNTTNLVQGS